MRETGSRAQAGSYLLHLLSPKPRTSLSSLTCYPPQRRTRVLAVFYSSVRILCLSPTGVKLAGVGTALKSFRICKEQMPATSAFWPRKLESRAASRLARHSARKRLEQRPSRRRRDKHKMSEARLLEHGWGRLFDLYEPYLLQKEMSGNF